MRLHLLELLEKSDMKNGSGRRYTIVLSLAQLFFYSNISYSIKNYAGVKHKSDVTTT